METSNHTENERGSLPVSLLRATLGLIVLATWWGNIQDGLYGAEGFTGLLNWLGSSVEDGGNGGTLGFVHSLLDTVVAPNAGLIGSVQLVVELAFGIGLLLGIFTRLSSLMALGFFVTLFLAYFGGEEWIWTYVLLSATALTVFLGYGGRLFGIDQLFGSKRSPFNLLW